MKVGDKVKLSEYGERAFPKSISNPHDVVGEIIFEDETSFMPLKVQWPNCFENWYYEEHLATAVEPATQSFQVGETYTTASGLKVKCIHIESGLAWCVFLHGGTVRGAAYTWGMDGEYQNAVESGRGPYQIKFGPDVEVKYQYTTIAGHPVTIKYTTKDGLLDEDSITADIAPF